jgi:transposase
MPLPRIGPISAAQLLISWSHRARFHSEAAFAMLAGRPGQGVLRARSSAIASTVAETGN